MLNLIDKLLSYANRLAGDYNRKHEKPKSFGTMVKETSDFIKEKKQKQFDEAARQQSLRNSQGKNDWTGSGYNGPGNVDREKRNSNMAMRNFNA